MPALKQIPNATIDLLLNDIATTTMVVYTNMTTNPTSIAGITGILAVRSGLTPGSGNGSFTVTSGQGITINSGAQIQATTSGTATCIILLAGGVITGSAVTAGTIKAIDTGSTVLTSGTYYTPAAFTIYVNTPN